MSITTSQQTLPQKAADAIIRLIQAENYTAGTKLPNEYELSRMLNVSRNTIREAIKLLVSRNILEVRRGAGTFVSEKHGLGDDPLGLSMITDSLRMFEDMLQLCFLIEPKSAALAAQYATKEDILKLCSLISELEILQQENHYSVHNDAAFHLQIAHCSNNTIIFNISTALYDCLIHHEDPVACVSSNLLKDHRRICQAIQNHNACQAYDAMMVHLLHRQELLQEQTQKKSTSVARKNQTSTE